MVMTDASSTSELEDSDVLAVLLSCGDALPVAEVGGAAALLLLRIVEDAHLVRVLLHLHTETLVVEVGEHIVHAVCTHTRQHPHTSAQCASCE